MGWGKYQSNLGRAIPYVEVGDGPTAVIIAAQQHGNEMETSDSVSRWRGTFPAVPPRQRHLGRS